MFSVLFFFWQFNLALAQLQLLEGSSVILMPSVVRSVMALHACAMRAMKAMAGRVEQPVFMVSNRWLTAVLLRNNGAR